LALDTIDVDVQAGHTCGEYATALAVDIVRSLVRGKFAIKYRTLAGNHLVHVIRQIAETNGRRVL